MAQPKVTVAAGAVVFRKGVDGGREVLLVHRPKYDDWTFPKGKLDRGEPAAAAAVREVEEETGLRVRLFRGLPDQWYVVGGTEKVVHYWVGRVLGDSDVSGYQPNREIDAVAWVPVKKAVDRLTYERDRDLLDVARQRRRKTSVVVVLRHGTARGRKSWRHDDRLRPLLAEGVVQSERLAPTLGAYAPGRVITSSSTRCVQTVTPFAAQAQVPIECTHDLSEEDATADGVKALVEELVTAGDDAVVCSHRPVLGWIMEALGVEPVKLEPGAMLVVHHRDGVVVSADPHPCPKPLSPT